MKSQVVTVTSLQSAIIEMSKLRTLLKWFAFQRHETETMPRMRSVNKTSFKRLVIIFCFSCFISLSALGQQKQNQTIMFTSLATKIVGDVPFALNATATSGLPVSYSSSNTSVATVSGNTVTIIGKGATEIIASQAGNIDYNAATNVKQTLIVKENIIDKYILLGSANATTSGCYQITPNLSNKTGAVWNENQINLNQDFDFTFNVNLCGSADGIAFVLQNYGVTTISDQTIGGRMGYYLFNGFSQSLAVELDIWNNAASDFGGTDHDPSNSHIAIVKNGLYNSIAGPINISPQLANCLNRSLRIVWNNTDKKLDVFLDGNFIVSYQDDILLNIFDNNPNVYFGLTGGTGGSAATQSFCITNLKTGQPNKPQPVTFSAVTFNSVTVNWSAPNNNGSSITSYTLEQKESASGNYSPIYTGTSTSFSVTGLTTGVDYYFRVNATNAIGSSLYSNDAIYTPAKANQTITFPTIPAKTYGNAPFVLAATASSGLPVSYVSSNTAVATVSGSTVTIVGAGTANITASQPGNNNYNAAPSIQQTLTVSKANQTIAFSTLPSKVFGDPAFNLTATASSGLSVSYTSSNTSVATVNGSTVTIVGAGTSTITASQTGNTNYNTASAIQQTLTINKANQTITFGVIPGKFITDLPFALNATTSSGLPVSYVSSNSAVATVNGNTVTVVGVGTSTITASQAGNTNYNAATSVNQTLTVAPNPNPVFNLKQGTTSIANDGTFNFGSISMLGNSGDISFSVSNSGTNPLIINLVNSSLTGANASDFALDLSAITGPITTNTVIVKVKFTPSAEGLRVAKIAVASNDPAQNPYYINLQGTGVKQNQTITFNALPTKAFGDPSFNLTAATSSALAVTYASSNPLVATVSGSTVTIVGVGTTVITASQPGNGNYNAATNVPQTLTVSKANQVINFSAIAAKTFNDPAFTLTGTASSQLSVAYTSSNTSVATISGNTVTIVGAGTSVITASQSGNGNYNAAAPVPQTLTVNKADQTITFASLAPLSSSALPFPLTATSSSGLTVTYSSSNIGVATVSGNTVTIVGPGNTTITAIQSGNVNYNAATSIDQVLTVKQAQNISFAPLPAKTFGDVPYSISSTSSSTLPVSFSSSNVAVATISGNTVTIIGAGNTIITASQAGNGSYDTAPEVSQTLTVNKAAQTITFASLSDRTLSDVSFTLTGSASSTLSVTYTTSSNKITLSGTQVTLVNSGRATITGSQAGNSNFEAAVPVDQSFCIKPNKPTISITNENSESPTLTSSSASGNQWYLNGTAIAGGTNATLNVTSAGVYKVQVKADDCVSEFSEDFPIIVTGDIPKNVIAVTVSPNPVDDVLEIRGLEGEIKSFHLLDLTGRTATFELGRNPSSYSASVNHLAPGMYILRVQVDSELHQIKFIKK